MGFSFEELSKQEVKFDDGIEGKKIMVYGTNDGGKTYQACHFPLPFLVMTEAGGSAVKCPKADCTEKWSQFKDIVNDLCKNAEKYRIKDKILQTVIIDTAENLVKLSERAICTEFGVRDLSEITGKQNGYNLARNDFQAQINRLTSKGYTVIFISHEEKVEETDEVSGEIYTFIQPKGTSNEKSSMRMIRDLVDFCIYTRVNGIDSETFETIPSTAICKRTKNVFARSRFAIDTIVNPFTAENIIKAIEDAVKKSADMEGAEIGVMEQSKSKTKEEYIELIKPYGKRLMEIDKDGVQELVFEILGEGRTIGSATDDEVSKLDTIYNKLVTKLQL